MRQPWIAELARTTVWCTKKVRRDLALLPEVCDGLAALLEAGVPLETAVAQLRSLERRFGRMRLVESAQEALKSGKPLSEAWAADVPPLFCALLAAGEHSGNLAKVLSSWASHVRRRRAEIQRYWRMASYPALLCALSGGLLLFTVQVLFPIFDHMYKDLGYAKPASARWVEDGIRAIPEAIVSCLIVIAFVGALSLWARACRFRLWDRLRRLVPGRRLRQLFRTYTLCMVLGLLLQAGIPMIDALRTIQSRAGPDWLKKMGERIADRLLAGESLERAFSGEFDPLLGVFMAWAEHTGDAAGALARVESFTGTLFHQRVQHIARVVEPAVVIAMGAIVASTMVVVFLPMYDVLALISSANPGQSP